MNNKHNQDIPLLSVRLMTYNHEPFIAQAIEGCLMQKTNFPFEIVIGDDFSTDNTLAIAKKYEQENPEKIRVLKRTVGDEYWKKRQKIGRYQNFIDILENCKGKYIALLDGDDYWTDPKKLQKQVDFLEKYDEYSFCCHAFQKVNSNKSIIQDVNLEIQEKFPSGLRICKDDIYNQWIAKSLTLVFKSNDLKISLKNQIMLTDFILVYYLLKSKPGYWLNINAGNYRVHDSNIYFNLDNLKKREFTYLTLKVLARSNKDDLFLKKSRIISNQRILKFLVQPNRLEDIKFCKIISFSFKLLLNYENKIEAIKFLYKSIYKRLFNKFKLSVFKHYYILK